ncbi:uncharacterized protein LOC121874830 [Homarus americanus]|uniref:uncharacterized protein LOC121874830 n=1 Tax=Homarus americanus TaxID=6706 RepID=UPI001C48C56E|nr:uncharacterized protein LOC121874830 [Homarus americanus]
MKSILVLFSIIALTWAGKDRDICHCAAFVSLPEGEFIVDLLPDTQIEDCDDAGYCQIRCTEEWVSASQDGDLDMIVGNSTLGQDMCDDLALEGFHNLEPEEVNLYYGLCDGPWMDNGLASIDKLCCNDGVYPGHC